MWGLVRYMSSDVFEAQRCCDVLRLVAGRQNICYRITRQNTVHDGMDHAQIIANND